MNRYLSTPPIFSAPVTNIDRELGIIQGVSIARVGLAKGHDGFIDRTFLLQIVDNAASKSAGIKARFGHPNMCSTALGTYLGRFKNYSFAADTVKADLYLDETAKSTPNGDLYSYVLDMAEKNPDMFGASIAFETSQSEFAETSEEGKIVRKEFYRLKDLKATDIVDEPAATDGLFSANTFPGLATRFLDENPLIAELIFSKPDSVTEFLANYLTTSKMNLSEKIKENFAAFLAAFSEQPKVTPDSELLTLNNLYDAIRNSYPEFNAEPGPIPALQKAESLTSFITSLHEKMTDASAKMEESGIALTSLQSELETLTASSEALNSQLEAANSRITELTEQLSARPSIPLNVTDPKLNLSTGDQEKDETGKQILSQLPKDLKRKLKQS